MWNSNSRRWLVINVADSLGKNASTPPTITTTTTTRKRITTKRATRLSPNLYFYSKKKCRAPDAPTRKTKRMNGNGNASGRGRGRGNGSGSSETALSLKKGASSCSRVIACPNQIIAVIVNILLANCLISQVAQFPTAGAAFGAETFVRDMDNAHGRSYYGVDRVNLLDQTVEYQPNTNTNNYNLQFDDQKSVAQLQRSQNFKISPKPCSIGRIEGTCMFVWECIKSEGRHVGMCVDSFMFGSCCSHNASDNIVLSQTFSYTRPTKPVGMSSLNHRPRPPPHAQRPGISGMTTIERPHGGGTLVIRPSGPHHQGVLYKPQPTKTKPTLSSSSNTHHTFSSSTKPPSLFVSVDMQSAASSSTITNMWHTAAPQHHLQQHHWQMSTEPNFITKPRPPAWEKPTSLSVRPPKPTKLKPTKKPIVYEQRPVMSTSSKPITRPTTTTTTTTTTTKTTSTTAEATTATRPKPPQFQTTQPMKTTTTTRPYFRPTAGWASNTTTIAATPSSTSASSSPTVFSSSSTQSHTLTPTATTQQHIHHLSSSSTRRPVAAPSSSIAPQQTPASFSLSTLETNEILDASSDTQLSTIKTVSAARSECGVPVLARPETRIVGGKSAAFGRWPWQVSVRRTSFFGFSSTHRCGGALINENWIATAGHCVDDLLISQIRIRVGEYDFSHVQEQLPYIERAVAKKVVHPKYNFFTYEYDLALVKLEQPLEFAPHVSPICLPQTDSLLIGMNATVTGWGRLSEGGTLPSVLQEVSVPIVSNDYCKSMFLRAGRQEFIPDIFLCAGYETGGQDSCQGDSGGPLQVKSQDGRFFLAGIISWGIGCAEANLPGVCTRISKFVPWIIENVT